MLGTNKRATVQRLNETKTAYDVVPFENLPCRFEPKKYTIYNTKEKQITFQFMSDLYDIQVADRMLIDGRRFAVAGVAKFTEVLGRHLEVIMREIGPTVVHEKVTIKRLDILQNNYDPLLEERDVTGKDYVEMEIFALLDAWEVAKEGIIKMLDSGKFENLDYVMTIDFPVDINIKDRVIYQGTEYEIKRIIPQIYQYQIGLKSSMVNYITNQD